MLHSERATELSEHHKALSSQGKRTDILKEIEDMLKADEVKNKETSRQIGEKLTSADETGKSYNLSGRTVSRYLRICNLIKELLNKVDIGEIPFTACVELSYLTEEEQHIVDDIVAGTKFKIDIKKAESLREFSEKKNLNQETAHSIISGELNKKQKRNKFSIIKLKPKLINKYFSSEVKQPEIEDIIDKALKLYFETQRKANL